MKLNDKVVLITGASSGIGRSLVEKLASKNCKFILLARREDILYKLLSDNNISEQNCAAFKCDVTDPKRVNECITSGYSRFGRIDIAILNAGISYRTSPEKFDPVKGREIIDVNLNGAINCLEVLIPLLQKQDKSIIAGVSSLADSRGFPKSGFYSSSKAAVSILLESLRIELTVTNIKVITVKPGFVRTPMTNKNEFRMPMLMEPERAAEIIIKGIEKEKRIIQFPLPVALGSKLLKIIPDALFEWLAYKHLTSFKTIFLKRK